MVRRQCKWCGKEFISSHKHRFYCSDLCREEFYKARAKPKKKICLNCGKPFYTTFGNEKYCSDECRTQKRNNYMRIYMNKRNHGGILKIYASKCCQENGGIDNCPYPDCIALEDESV